MKFKPGDKVRFLNEKGEGTVSKIINKTTVGVTIEDGFEIPFLITELVTVFDETTPAPPVHINNAPAAEEPVMIHKSIPSEREEQEEGIYFAFSPEKPRDIAYSDFNFWLINHTGYEIMYCISIFSGKGYEVVDKGEGKAFEAKLVETIHRKNIDRFSSIKIDVLFYGKGSFEHEAPVSEIVKFKTVKLYKENAFSENTFMPEKALIVNVTTFGEELYFDTPESRKVDLSHLLFQKKASSATQKTNKISKPHRVNDAAYEMKIDLHIEELMDNYSGMSNAEIVQVQLRHFQAALDTAINEHYRTLTVIHGVGNGRLKQEVRAILSSMNLRFQDGSYSRYGFGATDVVF